MQFFKKFLNDEDGAITVDFVVLTAAICLIGVIVVLTFDDQVLRLGNFIAGFMEDQCANGPCG